MFLFIPFLVFNMSITLTLNGNSSILNANYFPPIALEEDYECSLIDFHTYNSIPNVDEDNNLFHIGDNIIEIPIGSYELEDIADYLESEYEHLTNGAKSIKIEANNNTMRVEITTSHDSIYFNKKRTIGKLMGFNKKTLNGGSNYLSELPVNILKVNTIRIDCNIAVGSYINGERAHTIHEFGINVSPGYKMDEIPRNLIYLPLNTKEISSIAVTIVDQNSELINFRGENITLRLHLRSKQ